MENQKVLTCFNNEIREIKRIYYGTENGKKKIYEYNPDVLIRYVPISVDTLSSYTYKCEKYINNEWITVDYSFPNVNDINFARSVVFDFDSYNYGEINNIWYGGQSYFCSVSINCYKSSKIVGFANIIFISSDGQNWEFLFQSQVAHSNDYVDKTFPVCYDYYNGYSFFYDNNEDSLYVYIHESKDLKKESYLRNYSLGRYSSDIYSSKNNYVYDICFFKADYQYRMYFLLKHEIGTSFPEDDAETILPLLEGSFGNYDLNDIISNHLDSLRFISTDLKYNFYNIENGDIYDRFNSDTLQIDDIKYVQAHSITKINGNPYIIATIKLKTTTEDNYNLMTCIFNQYQGQSPYDWAEPCYILHNWGIVGYYSTPNDSDIFDAHIYYNSHKCIISIYYKDYMNDTESLINLDMKRYQHKIIFNENRKNGNKIHMFGNVMQSFIDTIENNNDYLTYSLKKTYWGESDKQVYCNKFFKNAICDYGIGINRETGKYNNWIYTTLYDMNDDDEVILEEFTTPNNAFPLYVYSTND